MYYDSASISPAQRGVPTRVAAGEGAGLAVVSRQQCARAAWVGVNVFRCATFGMKSTKVQTLGGIRAQIF